MSEFHDPDKRAQRERYWYGMIVLCGALAIMAANYAGSDRTKFEYLFKPHDREWWR